MRRCQFDCLVSVSLRRSVSDWRGEFIAGRKARLSDSTYGKVIRRGWAWLGMTSMSPERSGGLIEVPALAACLTLNKGDFIRTGVRGATYLAFRKAIQEAVSGNSQPGAMPAHPRMKRHHEKSVRYNAT
jgi:hypothetical protein